MVIKTTLKFHFLSLSDWQSSQSLLNYSDSKCRVNLNPIAAGGHIQVNELNLHGEQLAMSIQI